jgi:hypothetical protein
VRNVLERRRTPSAACIHRPIGRSKFFRPGLNVTVMPNALGQLQAHYHHRGEAASKSACQLRRSLDGIRRLLQTWVLSAQRSSERLMAVTPNRHLCAGRSSHTPSIQITPFPAIDPRQL